MRRAVFCMPATGALALVAVTSNPGGAAATKSPWLAQTRIASGRPSNSRQLPCGETIA